MPADHTKLEHATKRHARTRRGCLTCRIRKKKCDSSRPSCTKCERLHVQCLGYASDRPDWLKGDCAKGYTQAIKCFLSEYPAAKAYDDPVPYLVLKSTPEVERMLAADPGHYNPVYFDPDTASLKKWLPSVPPPQPPSRDPGFPVPPNAPSVSTNVAAPAGQVSSPFMPPTPSPQTPYSYPVSQYPVYSVDHAQDGLWPYTPPLADPYLQPTPFAATQPMYGLHASGITAPSFYDPQDGHAIHYVPGPMFMARQDAYTGAARKTGYDATWASLSGLLY